jgi:hypothetical protein
VEGKMLENGQVQFVGHHTLLMTDYDLEPPVAMFGALRTADEVTVHAELIAAPEMTGSQ